jgi:hypothetical protein
VGYSEDALYWLVLGRRGRQPAGAQSGNIRVIFVIRVRVSIGYPNVYEYNFLSIDSTCI